MQNSHPVFHAPDDPLVKIWRYMDFTKFVSILENRSLFFSRSDLLGDPFEGSYTKYNVHLRPIIYKNISENLHNKNLSLKDPVTGKSTDFNAYLSLFFKWLLKWTNINCWHINNYESAALWKIYSSNNESVAIQSSYYNLRVCLPETIQIGQVNYIDYDHDLIKENNTLWPFVHKRKSFSHENELRAVIQDLPIENNSIAVGKDNEQPGIYVPVDVLTLIENIYIAPSSASWFDELVKKVLIRYGLDKNVLRSSLDSDPVY